MGEPEVGTCDPSDYEETRLVVPFITTCHGDLSVDHLPTTTMKEKSHLDIVVDAQHLVLKGAGPDAEPVRLSGQVLLYLAEDTAIRELTLQFRGKAKIPVPASESYVSF